MVRNIPVVVPGSDAGSLHTPHAGTQSPCEYVEEESQRYGLQPTIYESTLARMDQATVILQSLNSILAEANMALLLEPLATQGDGYCFFYVAAGVCDMDVSQAAARQVFACALEVPVRSLMPAMSSKIKLTRSSSE